MTRSVVIRVTESLDETGVRQLERILHDLIVDQGVSDLLVDLSGSFPLQPRIGEVLARAKDSVEQAGGVLELRAPINPPPELLELADEIPTFKPL